MRLVMIALSVTVATLGFGATGAPAAPVPARDDGDRPRTEYTLAQARAAVDEHLTRVTRDSGGVYRLTDDQRGTVLDLELMQVSIVSASSLWTVHDADRHAGRDTFFACTLLHLVGAPPEKEYDVDMLIEPREGALAVTDVRIHKEKQLVEGKWVWKARPAPPEPAAKSSP